MTTSHTNLLPAATLLLAALFGLSTPAAAQDPAVAPKPPAAEVLARRLAAAEQRLEDWAGLGRYREANAQLGTPRPGERRVVFYGNSITDSWAKYFPAHFSGRPYVGRGISGQTTPQLLVRFRQDVIELQPAAVVILAGTNDIAGNTGPASLAQIAGNLTSMVELARANGIRVVLASVLPAYDYPWRPGLEPAAKIVALNQWLQQYSAAHDVVYLDYWSALADERQGLRAGLTADGVHPNEQGYLVMAPLAEAAIARALAPLLAVAPSPARAETGYDLWLRYPQVADAARLREYRAAITRLLVEGSSPTLDAARRELVTGLNGLLGTSLPVGGAVSAGTVVAGTPAGSRLIAGLPLAAELGRVGEEGYVIRTVVSDGRRLTVIAANRDVGVLYGAFAFLRLLQTHQPLADLALESRPKFELRMLDHWDNPNGSIERGYAGRSLWKWAQLPDTLDPRYVDYARANASLGINAVALTNVNANRIFLTPEYIVKAAALANVFRPYGIRVFLTARFSSPVELGGLPTADPLDPAVQAWWRQKADEVYALIPDFGGFLMKANSEGQPGPRDYDRSHAEGANLIADALAPHGGLVIWRAFVYASGAAIDRVKQAYDEFTPLDGQFRPNVFIQVKNGPLDFQPREPFSPLFGAMPKTPLMMELQITKEYLGQYSSLVYLGTMWHEVLNADTYARGPGSPVAKLLDGTLTNYPHTGIAGVANTGDDLNWCGSSFNQANWYAFGRLAWDHQLTAAAIADEWLRMTFSNDLSFVEPVKAMLLNSREAAVNYMAPLGLAHQMNGPGHYGPGAWQEGGPRPDWTPPYYARADSFGIGFDRTATGSNAVAQYHPPLDRRFADRATVGDTLLLWFHRVGWTERLPSGRTLWDELVRYYHLGVDTVRANLATWTALEGKVDAERFNETKANLEKELAEARWWRDASLLYWQTFSKLPIPAEYEQPAHPLEFYQRLRCPVDMIHSYCPDITGIPPHARGGTSPGPRR